MELFFALIVAVVAVLVIYLIQYYQVRKARTMTYEKFVSTCKRLIDEGKYDKLQSTLRLHLKLTLTHFNELQTTLTDYAREVEAREVKNN